MLDIIKKRKPLFIGLLAVLLVVLLQFAYCATKTGWFYENGYKLYYENGKLVTDLREHVDGPYVIRTNLKKNVVTVYALDEETNLYIVPVVNFICSAGSKKGFEDGHANSTGSHCRTPAGSYTVVRKDRWHPFPKWSEYVQYAVLWREDWGVYFHSLAYTEEGNLYSLRKAEYDALGKNASHGCVRLLAADAQWIYENFDNIVECVSYEDDAYGPYKKPKKPQIGVKEIDGETYYYDPTDFTGFSMADIVAAKNKFLSTDVSKIQTIKVVPKR